MEFTIFPNGLLRRLTRQVRLDVGDRGIREVGVVPDVEEVGREANFLPFAESEVLDQRESQFCSHGPRKMLRPRSPKPVVQKLGSRDAMRRIQQRRWREAAGFKYPLARVLNTAAGQPLAIVAPGARLAPSSGVLPGPRNAVPAPESRIENGKPDWKMETPLTCPSAERRLRQSPPNAGRTADRKRS